jgi:hypothetical protein
MARKPKTVPRKRRAAAPERKPVSGLDLRKEVRDMGKRLDYLMTQAGKAEAGASASRLAGAANATSTEPVVALAFA